MRGAALAVVAVGWVAACDGEPAHRARADGLSMADGGSPPTLATAEGAAVKTSVTLTSPTSFNNSFMKVSGTPLNLHASVEVVGFDMPLDGAVAWFLDTEVQAVGTELVHLYEDVPLGIHKIGVMLVDPTGEPTGGSSGKDYIQVDVSSSCADTSDCSSGNVCWETACIGGTCKYGPKGIPGCCASVFDCYYPYQCPAEGPLQNLCVECLVDGDCDDGSSCSVDSCGANGVCSNVKVPGCCNIELDCGDGGICDHCDLDTHTCWSKPNCCHTDADCTGDNPCAIGLCSPYEHFCKFGMKKPGCCTTDAMCDDKNPCTLDQCDTATNKCDFSEKNPVCCTDDAQCTDGHDCTVDSCDTATGACLHLPPPGGCCSNADCAPVDKCHVAACDLESGTCTQEPIPGALCCATPADCPAPESVCEEPICLGAGPGTLGVCHTAPISDCCATDSECDDNCLTTTDVCNPETHTCEFWPNSSDWETCGHCDYHADCDDVTLCTYDFCLDGVCIHIDKANCCETDKDCPDGNDCSIDKCINHRCKHYPPLTTPGMFAPPPDCLVPVP